jgi:hypothetical protein
MSWDPFQWWTDFADANTAGQARDITGLGDIPQAVSGWLASTAGAIASGIEGAMVAVLGDVWDVIAGPVLAIIGALIILFFVVWAFKNEIIAAVGAVAKAAA